MAGPALSASVPLLTPLALTECLRAEEQATSSGPDSLGRVLGICKQPVPILASVPKFTSTYFVLAFP